ncbi:MAG TPA: Gfo/Idh/MocA family oxidoreductase [Bacillaceae bacterium]
MNKLKVGIIGAGGIAKDRHIPALKRLSDKAVVEAVTDIHTEKAQEAAAAFDIPKVHETYQDMLEEVDAVVVCTPNKFHAEITVAA